MMEKRRFVFLTYIFNLPNQNSAALPPSAAVSETEKRKKTALHSRCSGKVPHPVWPRVSEPSQLLMAAN